MPLPFLAAGAGMLSGLAAGLGKVIGPLASLFGGKKSNDFAREEARRQEALQREFAQNGIRWRVADAKAAGLHPLYALGGNVPSYSPVSVQDSMGPAIAEAGQNISRAASAVLTPAERVLQDLAIEQARANLELTHAQRMALDSETARRAQTFATRLPHEDSHDPFSSMGQGSAVLSEREPAKQIQALPSDAGTAAGPTPLWRIFTLTTTPAGQDVPIVLPGGISGDAAEVLESLAESPAIMAMVIKENTRRFGPSWGKWFVEQYMPGGAKLNSGPNFPREYRHIQRFDFDERIQNTKDRLRRYGREAWEFIKRRFY